MQLVCNPFEDSSKPDVQQQVSLLRCGGVFTSTRSVGQLRGQKIKQNDLRNYM